MGSAWATLASYAAMMIVSYALGQRYYPIPYDLRRIFLYFALAVGLYFMSLFIPTDNDILKYALAVGLIAVFSAVVWVSESRKKPLLSQGS